MHGVAEVLATGGVWQPVETTVKPKAEITARKETSLASIFFG
jgi:hypothetical protein